MMGNRLLHVVSKLLFVLILFTFFANIYCFFKPGAKIGRQLNYLRTCKTDKDPPQILSLNYFKYNRSHFAVAANFTALEPFDKSYKLHIEIQKWGDGGWKRNFVNIDRNDVCGNLQLFGSSWREVLKAAGIKPKCPIEPGFYKLDAYATRKHIETHSMSVVAFPGKFYVLVHILKHGKITICVESEAEVYEIYY